MNALITTTTASSDIAATASAALQKATIEAKFTIAMHRPRSVLNARAAILDACKRPAFAEGAIYRVKRGRVQNAATGEWEDNYIEGLSIRFAEQALNAWRNVDVAATTAWENESNRLVRITVTDLETNLSYTDEVMLSKTVERKKVRDGQEVIGQRETSTGETVFIVKTTDDELQVKLNAAKSKSIRNSGLRLIPQDILEEAENAVRQTIAKGGADPKAQIKKLCDAFGSVGVTPVDLEMFLGHSLDGIRTDELANLRGIYSAIRDGDAKWSDYQPSTTPEPDEIPGAESPAPPPSKRGRKPKSQAEPEPQPSSTVQEQLQSVVIEAGFNFDDFLRWGEVTQNVPQSPSPTCFSELDASLATRLLRAKDGLLDGINSVKGSNQ